ncbi:MAG: hypothetical protein J6S49_08110 [Erysipelotrichaceae bacterium]|nr:hypothetical protein [Erysipelotrichaceae bacterium]
MVCVIILLIKLIKVMSSVDVTLLKTHGTIDLVDTSIEKLQAPLDTAVKVSETVDKAHDATIEAAKEVKDFVVENAGDIKEKVTGYINEFKKKKDAVDEELKEPDPEDVIGG